VLRSSATVNTSSFVNSLSAIINTSPPCERNMWYALKMIKYTLQIRFVAYFFFFFFFFFFIINKSSTRNKADFSDLKHYRHGIYSIYKSGNRCVFLALSKQIMFFKHHFVIIRYNIKLQRVNKTLINNRVFKKWFLPCRFKANGKTKWPLQVFLANH
jgi:hypothetical protein